MNRDLLLLDQIEEIRQKSIENPKAYPVDYTIRVISAIVARHFGYEGRSEWTEELKKHPESNFTKRLTENRFFI